jgi:mycothiol synthase
MAGADVPVPGLLLRHVRWPVDIPALNAIANAERLRSGQDFYSTDEQFRLFYETLANTDIDEDVAVAEIDGRIVGYGRTGWRDEPGGTRICEVVTFVDQQAPAEVYATLFKAIEAHARQVNPAGPGSRLLQASGGDTAPDREKVLRDLGYEPVRHFFSMVRPTLDDIPDYPLPEGLEIREVQPDHLPAIWAADQEAFRDEWGYVEATDADYERFTSDPVQSDASLWRIAWDGNEVAGQVRSYVNAEENERFGRLRGYTEHISVRRPWRRRGVARALIAASLAALHELGMAEAGLGVDTNNPSGALQLYMSMGFEPVHRSTIFHKRIA